MCKKTRTCIDNRTRPSACTLCGKDRSLSFLLYLALLYLTLLYFTLLYFTLLYFTLLYFTLLYCPDNRTRLFLMCGRGRSSDFVNPLHSTWLYFTLLYSIYNFRPQEKWVFLRGRGRFGWLLIHFPLLYSILLYIYTILCFTTKDCCCGEVLAPC